MIKLSSGPAFIARKAWSASVNSISSTLPGGPLGVSAGKMVVRPILESGITDT